METLVSSCKSTRRYNPEDNVDSEITYFHNGRWKEQHRKFSHHNQKQEESIGKNKFDEGHTSITA
jgi:hypothetical protein